MYINTLNEDEKNSWYSICFSLLGNFVTCTVRSCDRNFEKLEMENISVVEKSDTITAAFETSVYRGAYNGIGIAIRHLVAMPEMPTLQLVILDNALPQLCITLPAKLVQQYQSGEYTLDEVYRNMEMTTSTGTAMRRLKGIKRKTVLSVRWIWCYILV